MDEYKLYPAGDCAINVTFSNRVDPQINRSIQQLQENLRSMQQTGITGFVPAFRTLTVFYDPILVTFEQLKRVIHQASLKASTLQTQAIRIVHIPVCYGKDFGPDLKNVANHAKLTPREVVKRHCQPNYLIYMLGFLPGFVYLGGLDPQLATPRLATPRLKIEPGAVGIAGEQTGIYPIESPGGWQIIGQTPLRLFQPDQDEPFYYHAGDYIHFDPVSDFEYQQIKKMVDEGYYQVYIETRKVTEDGDSSDTAGITDDGSGSGKN